MAGYAVLVGIDNFKSFPTHKLQFCENDAETFSSILLSSPLIDGLFAPDRVVLIKGEDATRDNVYNSMNSLFSRAGKDDQIWFFAASHGYTSNNENYLYSHNASSGSDAAKNLSCLKLQDIRSMMSESKAQKKFVFLDCCHASSVDFVNRDEGEQLFSMQRARSTFDEKAFAFLNSCSEGELSYECAKLSHGVWSNFLFRALTDDLAAWEDGKLLTVSSLQNYLTEKVPPYVKAEFNASQNPDIEIKGNSSSVQIHLRLEYSESVELSKPTKKSQNALARLIGNIEKRLTAAKAKLPDLLRKIGRDAAAENIENTAADLQSLIARDEGSPVAMIGRVGCGKTTLLNALCGAQVGLSGGGGAMSAATLVVRYLATDFKIKIKYLTLEEVQETIESIIAEDEDELSFLSDDNNDGSLSEDQFHELSQLLIDPNVVLERDITLDDLRSAVGQKIIAQEESIPIENNNLKIIPERISEFSDSAGEFWRVTKQIEISGPFNGLSPGMEVMDLPGFGDLNPLRVAKAKTALKDIDQVIIVTDGRGIYKDVSETLREVGLMTSILTSPEIGQIVFVGTHIDAGRVSVTDVRRLKLPENYTSSEAANAQFTQWKESTATQWRELLQREVRRTKTAQHVPIDTILNNTKFIPVSPEGYLCLSGLQHDPQSAYKHVFPAATSVKKIEAITGISELRETIGSLIIEQKALKIEKIKKNWVTFKTTSIEFCGDCAAALDSDIQVSKNDESLIQDFLRVSKGAIHSEDIYKSYEIDIVKVIDEQKVRLSKEIKEKWSWVNRKNMQTVLRKNYGSLNFMILKATVRRRGIFSSKGKEKAIINMTKDIGMQVDAELRSTWNLIILEKLCPMLEKSFLKDAEMLRMLFEEKLDELINEGSKTEEFASEAKSILGRLFERSRVTISEMVNEFRELSEIASEMSERSIGYGFETILLNALEGAKGKGARDRIIESISNASDTMIPSICSRTVDHYLSLAAETAKDRAQTIYANLNEQTNDAVKQLVEAAASASSNLQHKDRVKFSKEFNRLKGVLERDKY